MSLTIALSRFPVATLSGLPLGRIDHSGSAQEIFCGGDSHVREAERPLRGTAQRPLILCQVAQNASSPLNLSTGREESPHPGGRIYEFISVPTNVSRPEVHQGVKVAVCIMCPCDPREPISFETLRGPEPLLLDTVTFVQAESGNEDLSSSIGNDPIKPPWWL